MAATVCYGPSLPLHCIELDFTSEAKTLGTFLDPANYPVLPKIFL